MKTQKDAVVNAVLQTLEAKGIDYQIGKDKPVKEYLNSDDTKAITAFITQGLVDGDVHMTDQSREKYNTPELMKKYASGLVNNWIRKYKGFNEGNAYQAKNPGSRAGSQDETIKALRALLKQTEGEDDRAEIQEAIKDRLAEIRPKTVVEINPDAIPEHLRHLVNN